MTAADTFHPEHALVIRNKDEFIIPLILETVPAPGEFRDAIESLSPEQQDFCKAYRQMQVRVCLTSVKHCVFEAEKPHIIWVLLTACRDSLRPGCGANQATTRTGSKIAGGCTHERDTIV